MVVINIAESVECLCHYDGVMENEDEEFKYTRGETKARYIAKNESFEAFVRLMEIVCANEKNQTNILIQFFVFGVLVEVKDDHDYQAMLSLYESNPELRPLKISISKHNITDETSELPHTEELLDDSEPPILPRNSSIDSDSSPPDTEEEMGEGMICMCHHDGVVEKNDGEFNYTEGEATIRYIGKNVDFEDFVHMMEDICENDENETNILMEYFVSGVLVKVCDDTDYQAMFDLYHQNPEQPLQIWITKYSITGETTEEISITGDTSKLPHKYQDIIKEADSPMPHSSTEEILSHLRSGVLLSQKTKKYWIDESGKNCFTLFPRDVWITWVDDERYWKWLSLEDIISDGPIDIPELLVVWRFEVFPVFSDTSNLTPETTYEVVFEVMLKDNASGWEAPVNLKLEIPDGEPLESTETLHCKPKGQWIEIRAGEFRTSGNNGMMRISMFNHDFGIAKKGLLVKGVTIRPKK